MNANIMGCTNLVAGVCATQEESMAMPISALYLVSFKQKGEPLAVSRNTRLTVMCVWNTTCFNKRCARKSKRLAQEQQNDLPKVSDKIVFSVSLKTL